MNKYFQLLNRIKPNSEYNAIKSAILNKHWWNLIKLIKYRLTIWLNNFFSILKFRFVLKMKINVFPFINPINFSDTIQILTSGVITCTSGIHFNFNSFPLTFLAIFPDLVGLRSAAFQYASRLMHGENRSKIDEKYRRKIELVLR